MSALVEHLGWLVPMLALIGFSALFSGSEAALFTLSSRDRRRLSRSGVGGRVADRLLGDSERLLSAILFWNLLINMSYFAIASIVAGKLESSPDAGATVALIFTAVSLLAIIFFSEMLPKSIAVLSPLRTSALVAPPLSLAIRLVQPLLPLVKTSNLLASRLLWPSFEAENEIDLADIERAVELGTDDAALVQRERETLRSLVEIAEMRASELMRPRSKLKLMKSPLDREQLLSGDIPGGYAIVTDQSEDKMIGSLGVRTLRPSQIDNVDELIEPVLYVPWSAKVAKVFDELNEHDVAVAIVVDEYGDGIGALSVDRIFRRLLAPRHDLLNEAADSIAVKQLGDDSYQVSGAMSLRQLAKQLDVELTDESIATVAGFIQRNNERLPRLGDEAELGPYRMRVTKETTTELKIEIWRTVPFRERDSEVDE
ncbi:MAG: CNNM domain-containing protein [Planctomycetota bacterium]